MYQPRPYRPGDRVVCTNDTNGAHFLVAGREYLVEHVQVDSHGEQRLFLVGMVRGWETSRFRLA